MRIGVLSGGGDAPGLNAVIRAVTKTAIFKYGWEVTGIIDGFEGLLSPDEDTPAHLMEHPGHPVRRRHDPRDDESRQPLCAQDRRERQRDRRGHVRPWSSTISGSWAWTVSWSSAATVLSRSAAGSTNSAFPVIGVPKTIDNDLMATYVTFGFQTAVDTATEALDKLHTTAESHQRVIILEVMGRYAGWIALEAGMSGSADVILIPEIPFSMEKVAEKLLERKKAGSKSSIVVVAEGAKPAGGEMAVREKASDGYVLRLGGMGEIVANEISKRTEHRDARDRARPLAARRQSLSL